MNEAFEAFCKEDGIKPDGDYAREALEIFRAGMLAAAEICDAQDGEPECPERAKYCAEAIREAAKS